MHWDFHTIELFPPKVGLIIRPDLVPEVFCERDSRMDDFYTTYCNIAIQAFENWFLNPFGSLSILMDGIDLEEVDTEELLFLLS